MVSKRDFEIYKALFYTHTHIDISINREPVPLKVYSAAGPRKHNENA